MPKAFSPLVGLMCPQKKEKQIPCIQNPTNTPTPPTSITYSLLLTARGIPKEYPSIPWATQENLELNPPFHSLDSHQK